MQWGTLEMRTFGLEHITIRRVMRTHKFGDLSSIVQPAGWRRRFEGHKHTPPALSFSAQKMHESPAYHFRLALNFFCDFREQDVAEKSVRTLCLHFLNHRSHQSQPRHAPCTLEDFVSAVLPVIFTFSDKFCGTNEGFTSNNPTETPLRPY